MPPVHPASTVSTPDSGSEKRGEGSPFRLWERNGHECLSVLRESVSTHKTCCSWSLSYAPPWANTQISSLQTCAIPLVPTLLLPAKSRDSSGRVISGFLLLGDFDQKEQTKQKHSPAPRTGRGNHKEEKQTQNMVSSVYGIGLGVGFFFTFF